MEKGKQAPTTIAELAATYRVALNREIYGFMAGILVACIVTIGGMYLHVDSLMLGGSVMITLLIAVAYAFMQFQNARHSRSVIAANIMDVTESDKQYVEIKLRKRIEFLNENCEIGLSDATASMFLAELSGIRGYCRDKGKTEIAALLTQSLDKLTSDMLVEFNSDRFDLLYVLEECLRLHIEAQNRQLLAAVQQICAY